jgi:[acyl-carrier-protein] S-malonyltransferase
MTLGIMFTGQGSETVGMGLDFVKEYKCVKQLFNRAKKVLGYDPLDALNNQETFMDTSKIQPLTFLFQASVLELLRENKVASNLSFGLSLGEYAALYDAGVFSFETGLEILKIRGTLMQEAALNNPGKMVALMGIEANELEPIINDINDVVVANYNTRKQLVISGTKTGVDNALEQVEAAGVKRAIPLNTVGAFHSFLMQEAADQFEQIIKDMAFYAPKKTVYVNVTGQVLEGSITDNLTKQITSSVRFYQMIEALDYVDVLIEIGPKKVLCNMVKRIDKSIQTAHINDVSSFESVLEVLKDGVS